MRNARPSVDWQRAGRLALDLLPPPRCLRCGEAVGESVGADWLVRRRATPSQGRQNRRDRRRNVAGAFAVKPGRDVAGQRIVLVDDVLTPPAPPRPNALGCCRRPGRPESTFSPWPARCGPNESRH
jgi:hypothetical protein